MDNQANPPEERQQKEEDSKESPSIHSVKNIINNPQEKKILPGAEKKATKLAGKMSSKLAKQGATKLATLAASNPVGIIVVCIIAGIFLFILIYFYFFTGKQGSFHSNQQSQSSTPSNNQGGFSKVNGFKLTLDCSDEVPTTEGIATCTITYTYDSTIATVPLENIVIHFELPENTTYSTAAPTPTTKDSAVYSWPLSDPINQNNILISFTNNQTDRYVDTYAYISFVDSGPGGGATCTAPHEGTGPCSVAELSKIFTGDPSRAIAASMICQKESTSNPLTKNITSGTGCNMDGKNNDDYSIGLFQINLIWHGCKVAGNGYSNSPSSERCQNLIDPPSRNSCENLLESSDENIQKAYQISSGGTDWSAWSTWLDHPEWNYVGVKSRLDNCGITVQ